jgi:hypothetical protein
MNAATNPVIKSAAPNWTELSFVAYRIERGHYKPENWLAAPPLTYGTERIAAYRVAGELLTWAAQADEFVACYAIGNVIKAACAILAAPLGTHSIELRKFAEEVNDRLAGRLYWTALTQDAGAVLTNMAAVLERERQARQHQAIPPRRPLPAPAAASNGATL